VSDEPLRDRRALAAGQDERRQPFQVSGHEDTSAFGAEVLEGGQVLLDVPLDAEDADDRS